MGKSSGGECPSCYGSDKQKPECDSCEFLESCRYYASSKSSERSSGDVSYDRYSYAKEVSSLPETPSETADNGSSDLASSLQVLEFLLDVDNYTAELLSEVLRGANSTEDLAKKFGKSRQAIHRKLVDCCTEHPELRSLFITRLYKCRRIMSESSRLQKKRLAAEEKLEREKQIQPELFQ